MKVIKHKTKKGVKKLYGEYIYIIGGLYEITCFTRLLISSIS